MRFLALLGFLASEGGMVIYLASRIKMGEGREGRGGGAAG
jgi:hypothetical protein